MNAMICRPSPSLASSSDPHAEPSHDGTPHKPPHPGLPRANSNRQLPTYPESVARVLTPEEAYAASPTLGKWTLPPEDSDIDMVEDTRLLFQDSGYDTSPCATDDSKARRRWMKDSDNRHSVVFRKDRVYDMEIYAPLVFCQYLGAGWF